MAEARIDVNEYLASGKSASDFEQIPAAAQTPIESASSKLSPDTPDAELAKTLDPDGTVEVILLAGC